MQRPIRKAILLCGVSIFVFLSNTAMAQFQQEGPKLVGAGDNTFGQQGWSVSLSGEGTTLIIGGLTSDGAWVFTRNAGQWTQQGGKLIGSDESTFGASQGWSVAISADGNTAIVGGPADGIDQGAAWVFVRSGGVWTQQGPKLVGTGGIGNPRQGESAALSADGNTAIVGGPDDDSGAGAAWIFTRNGSVWSEQAKLVGTGAVGQASQGHSVSLSGDGNTAAVGGPQGFDGATWIFTRTGGTWTQQGSKLVGTGGSNSHQGVSVSLAADGNTLIVGGPDDIGTGAAWIFVRTGNLWIQQGDKLVGNGVVGNSNQGRSVALSGDGHTAIVGASGDHPYIGAAWVFRRDGSLWRQLGSKLVGADATGVIVYQGDSVALSADGSTAIVGGHGDNSNTGAVWVYALAAEIPSMTRSGLALLVLALAAAVTLLLKTYGLQVH